MSKEQKAIELTKANARRLDQLAKLVSTPASKIINLMIKESLDSYLDKDSGFLIETVDGWKYKSEAEARKVAALIHAWEQSNGHTHKPMRVKGRQIVNFPYRNEKAEYRKYFREVKARQVA